MNLTEYLSSAIERIFKDAMRASLSNTKESAFLLKAVGTQKKAARKRLRSEQEGNPIPPFLIASIATRCNLHCAGCYARANHVCGDQAAARELSAARWAELFREAADLGVSFILLAGGEPLERPEVVGEAAKISKVIFPVFTNGTLLTEKMLRQFDASRNLIPVLSVEGDRSQTDERRGEGTFDLVTRAMGEMKRRGIFYGASITVTTENLRTVSGDQFIAGLRERGCRLVFTVEYVPVDGQERLAPGEEERRTLADRLSGLRQTYPDMIFLSFPGDEEQMGGCLAAGRGFFHINAFGGAEPCPFSPYSDTSLETGSLRQALESTLFRKIRESGIEEKEHIGGCTLFRRRAEVENLLTPGSAE